MKIEQTHIKTSDMKENKAWPYRASEESLAQSDFVRRILSPNRISVSTEPISVCFLQTFEEPDPQLNRHLSCSSLSEVDNIGFLFY